MNLTVVGEDVVCEGTVVGTFSSGAAAFEAACRYRFPDWRPLAGSAFDQSDSLVFVTTRRLINQFQR